MVCSKPTVLTAHPQGVRTEREIRLAKNQGANGELGRIWGEQFARPSVNNSLLRRGAAIFILASSHFYSRDHTGIIQRPGLGLRRWL